MFLQYVFALVVTQKSDRRAGDSDSKYVYGMLGARQTWLLFTNELSSVVLAQYVASVRTR